MPRPLLAALMLVLACAPQPVLPNNEALTVAVAEGDAQTAIGRTYVPVLPTVRVTTASGEPRAGVMVRFEVTDGGGTTTEYPVPTDDNGLASADHWKLGPPGVQQRLTAYVTLATNHAVVFRANAITGPIFRLVDTSNIRYGEEYMGTVGELVDPKFFPVFMAVDVAGNPVAGVPLTWELRGGGAITTADSVTGPDGKARLTSWRLSTVARMHQVAVYLGPVSVRSMHAIGMSVEAYPGPVATIERLASEFQTAVAGSTVAEVPRVRLRDRYGNPAFPRQVIFTVLSGGGSVDNTHQIAASDGTAGLTLWRLGPTPGENRLRVTADQMSIDFVATGTP